MKPSVENQNSAVSSSNNTYYLNSYDSIRLDD